LHFHYCGEVQLLRGQVRWGCGEWRRDEYSWWGCRSYFRRVHLTSFWRRLESRWWNERGIGDTADDSRTHRGSQGEYEQSPIENVYFRRIRLTSFCRRLESRWWNDWGIGDTADNSRTHSGSGGEYEQSPMRIFGLRHMYKTWRLSRALEWSMQWLVYRRLECMKNSLNDGSKDILLLTLSAVLKANKTQSPEDVSIRWYGEYDFTA
jgi:hypothetical protein